MTDTSHCTEADVRQVVDEEGIMTLFQPVVSVPTVSIIGFEAFSHAHAADNDSCSLDANILFSDQWDDQVQTDVDQLCLSKALERFLPIRDQRPTLCLFLNLNRVIIDSEKTPRGYLHDVVEKIGLDPRNVIFECTPARALKAPVEFFEEYRQRGYFFCLDNTGLDGKFLDAVNRFMPDYIKVNRDFFADGADVVARMRSLQGLVSGHREITVIAQCVETAEESIRLLEAGVHLQQGYYYTKEQGSKITDQDDPVKNFMQKIRQTYLKYRERQRKAIGNRRTVFSNNGLEVGKIASLLSRAEREGLDKYLPAVLSKTKLAQAAFVLNGFGEQVTRHVRRDGKKPASLLWESASNMGSNHAVQDYYVYLEMGYDKFISKPYTCAVQGGECYLHSIPFYNADNEKYYLCVEMDYPASGQA